MNLFTWAKQKLSSAFAKSEYKAPARPQHPAKAQAAELAKKLGAEAVRRRRSPTQAQRRKWKWFHISKWPIRDKQGGEVTSWAHKTFVLGRNAMKRKLAGGLAPKTARRLRIRANHAKLVLKAKFDQAIAV